jgi:hypothetical protein
MNIFVLHKNPALSARMHADIHTTKMLLESAQLLSTAIKVFDPNADYLYRMAFKNHPCAKWTRESRSNFNWLIKLGVYLNDEYFFRYGRKHKSFGIILQSKSYEHLIPDGNLTPFVQAMPDEYKIPDNPVKAYRNYYRCAKKHLLIYTRRQPPGWIKDIARYKQI